MFKKMFEKALNIEKRSTMGLFPIKKVDKDAIVPINYFIILSENAYARELRGLFLSTIQSGNKINTHFYYVSSFE